MSKLALVSVLVLLAAFGVVCWRAATPNTSTDVTVLRDQLAAAWRARDYSDEQYRLKQQEVYVLQRAFAGCVCQDAGVDR